MVQTYDNCRRFEVDSSISYGQIVEASQPGFKQATGGTGGELGTTTEALEKGENTGLEVGAPAGSAGFAGRSPNIPPQPPPAASQPPLFKAVRTSPKRNAPSEDRPPRSPRNEKESLLKRYGYHSTAPYEDKEDSFIPSRYGYYVSDFDRPPLREPPPEDEQVPGGRPIGVLVVCVDGDLGLRRELLREFSTGASWMTLINPLGASPGAPAPATTAASAWDRDAAQRALDELFQFARQYANSQNSRV